MQFDVTLNVVWLVLGFAGFGMAVRTVVRSHRSARRQWLLLVRVGLIIAALFPYISASDDVLRIDHDQAQHQQHEKRSDRAQTDNLMRLYAAMDTPLICAGTGLVTTFRFIALVAPVSQSGIERCTPRCAGRSPPASSFA